MSTEKSITPEEAVIIQDPCLKEIVWKYFARYYGSAERATEFIKLAQRMTGTQFWEVLHSQWSGFDVIDHFAMKQLLQKFAVDWDVKFLETNDRAFYESLPKEVIIYRGQATDSLIGLSWTTDYEVAKSFSQGHRGYLCPNPLIIKAQISKQKIAGVYTDRAESEVLLFDINDAEIIQSIAIAPRVG